MALTGYEGCPLYHGTELLAEPGAFEDMLVGNAYLVIDRVTGRSHFDV